MRRGTQSWATAWLLGLWPKWPVLCRNLNPCLRGYVRCFAKQQSRRFPRAVMARKPKIPLDAYHNGAVGAVRCRLTMPAQKNTSKLLLECQHTAVSFVQGWAVPAMLRILLSWPVYIAKAPTCHTCPNTRGGSAQIQYLFLQGGRAMRMGFSIGSFKTRQESEQPSLC